MQTMHADVMEQVADCTLQNQSLQASKRKLDSEMQTMHADLEEMLNESRIAEEKAKKAMIDAARLADELRAEQENAQHAERNRRALDCQVKDMQVKLDEAEQLAVKGGKKVTSRLEQKIKDLEGQMDEEQRRLVEAQKSQRRTDRRVKELTFSQEEDCKNHERMQELVDKLQNKVKRLKKLKKLLLLILQSLEKCRLTLNRLKKGLISTSRSWQNIRPKAAEHLLDLSNS